MHHRGAKKVINPKCHFPLWVPFGMGEAAVLRPALPFGIPGVLRSKAMLTCHVRNASCTAPLTSHSELAGNNSDRQTGSLQAPKTKSHLIQAHSRGEENFLENFGRTSTSEKSVSGTALAPGRRI